MDLDVLLNLNVAFWFLWVLSNFTYSVIVIALQTMSSKEKGKFEDMAKADKLRYEKEMKNYVPPKGETKKKFKDPNAPKRPP